MDAVAAPVPGWSGTGWRRPVGISWVIRQDYLQQQQTRKLEDPEKQHTHSHHHRSLEGGKLVKAELRTGIPHVIGILRTAKSPEFQTIRKFHICLQKKQEKGIQRFPSGASLAAVDEPPQERLWEEVRGRKSHSVGRFERERKQHWEIKIQMTPSAGPKSPKSCLA